MDLVEWRLTSHNIMLQRAILRMYKDCGWLVVTDMFFSLQTPPNASTATASSSSSGEYSSVTSLHVSSLFYLCFLKPYFCVVNFNVPSFSTLHEPMHTACLVLAQVSVGVLSKATEVQLCRGLLLNALD